MLIQPPERTSLVHRGIQTAVDFYVTTPSYRQTRT